MLADRLSDNNLLLADSIHNAHIGDDITEYEIDSMVLALPRTQPLSRMHTKWTGPYRVVSKEGGK